MANLIIYNTMFPNYPEYAMISIKKLALPTYPMDTSPVFHCKRVLPFGNSQNL